MADVSVLTPRQRECWELQQSGLTRLQIGERLGITDQTVNWTLHHARRRLGIPLTQIQPPRRVREERVLLPAEASAEPVAHRRSPRLSPEKIPDRLSLKLKLREVRTQDLLSLVSSHAQNILEGITEYDLASASLKDKVIAAAILIEKRQLLSGEPTQILDVRERHDLNELLVAVLAEARKRGMTIDVTPMASGGVPGVDSPGMGLLRAEQQRREAKEHFPERHAEELGR